MQTVIVRKKRTASASAIAAIFLLPLFLRCGDRTVFEYKEDSSPCCKTNVPVGSGEASINVSILTDQAGLFEKAYPALSMEYVSEPQNAGSLQKIDADLMTDKTAEPALVEIGAGFFDAFTTDKFAHSVPASECCARLDLRIKNDAAAYQGDYGPVHFGVKVRKEYTSLRPLPAEMTLVIVAETDRGIFRETRRLRLTSRKSQGGVPFRFH